MGRLILASNRLPVSAVSTPDGLRVEQSAGGLASAVRGLHDASRSVWIGWPGESERLRESDHALLERELSRLGAVPVWLSDLEVRRFYDGFSNGVLWPVLHYMTGVLPLRVQGWREYEAVNQRFADAIVAHYRPGDTIWVHDYHLMLVPALVRARVRDARIGLFLHTPFPSPDLFAVAPHRDELLLGLLGADLIGFHTRDYLRHFQETVERILGMSGPPGEIASGGRTARLGCFPIGVDAAALESAASQPAVAEEAARLRGDRSFRLMVGIDRLDYTKGIPRRLLALEDLLSKRPEWREAVTLLQVAVPSRTRVGAYQRLRAEVDEIVFRINDRFATSRWTPIRYMHRSVNERELLALYRAADVMLVTPIRDGMNLVAKEFVASRVDGDGVLVLSEFAGAAAELTDAVLVNPYDVSRASDSYFRALTMPVGERRARMRAMRATVAEQTVQRWASTFLDALHSPAELQVEPCVPALP